MPSPITERHKIITWFASNPVVANLMMVTIILSGIYMAFTVRKEGFPSFDANTVRVSVPIRGGNPEDVERGITIKVEEALENVDGIDNIRSSSSENSATITITALEDYALNKLLSDIKVQVDAIQNLPEQVENPVITEIPRTKQVLWVEVSGEQTERNLRETARKVRDALLEKPNISRVSAFGMRDYEISIEVSEEKLKLYDLTFNEVANAIQQNSIDLSGGSISTDRGEISLRIREQAYVKSDFDKIPVITSAEGVRVYVKDVATVVDGFIDQKFLNRFNGKPTVSLRIVTQGNEDIIEAENDARAVLKEFKDLPENVSLYGWLDGSKDIKDRLSLLQSNAISGILLVLIVLTLFLNLRLALWVAIGIPISFAGALLLFPLPGVDLSINLISAFGFIVVLGIVVDDAIVIGEAIYTEKEQEDEAEANPISTTVRGVSKVVTPATFGVITTIAAFLPLTQVSGNLGNVFGQLATVVIFCLIFSLVESKLILPAHLSHIKVNQKPRNLISAGWAKFQRGINKITNNFITHILLPSLRVFASWRYVVITLFIAILLLVTGMFKAGKIKSQTFPDIYRDSVSVNLELEQGQSVEYLHSNATIIAESAAAIGKKYEDKYGENPFLNIQTSCSTNTNASIATELRSSTERDLLGAEELSTASLVKEWRKKVGSIAVARSLSFSAKAGPPGGDLKINLESESLEELQAAAEKLKAKLRETDGVFDVFDSFDSGKPEIRYAISPAGEAAGLTKQDLASNIRDAFFGREAQRVQRGRDEVRVMVRFPEEKRKSLDTLRDMRIRKQDGTSVPFAVAADTAFGESLASISRYNGKRVVTVEGSIDKAKTSGQDVLKGLEASFFSDLKAEFPSISITQAGQAEQRAKSFASLKQGFLISLILIYLLLAIPLKSYIQPLLIMSVIPFGIIGALMGHYLIGIPVSLLSLFGILALSGVVVNDSLVLVTRVSDLTKEGLNYRDAVIQASGQRFRAILLTSLTTFFGLLPLLFETATQAQFLKPMAASLAFGVAFATLITLVLLPMILLMVEDLRKAMKALYS